MTIKHILDAKGREVFTIEQTETIASAAQLLCRKGIGALAVVESDQNLVGIISERDVVRIVVAEGAGGLDRPLSTVMTRDPVTGREAMTLNEAMEAMTLGRFRHLPICEDGKLVGIVSIGDAVKRRIEDVEREAEELRSYIHAG